MIMSQIVKSVNFTKTLKPRYLVRKKLFFLQIKKFINDTSWATLFQKKKKKFVAELPFKV